MSLAHAMHYCEDIPEVELPLEYPCVLYHPQTGEGVLVQGEADKAAHGIDATWFPTPDPVLGETHPTRPLSPAQHLAAWDSRDKWWFVGKTVADVGVILKTTEDEGDNHQWLLTFTDGTQCVVEACALSRERYTQEVDPPAMAALRAQVEDAERQEAAELRQLYGPQVDRIPHRPLSASARIQRLGPHGTLEYLPVPHPSPEEP